MLPRTKKATVKNKYGLALARPVRGGLVIDRTLRLATWV